MIYTPNIFDAEQDAKEMVYRANTGWDEEFGKYSRFYHITTETVKDYISKFSGDTALTVGASADQAIALNRNGIKEVYLFDINRTDYYFINLKRCALLTLKRKEFLDFLICEANGINIMHYSLYEKVRNSLDAPTRVFWDFIYKAFSYNNMLMADQLFRSPIRHAKMSRTVNDYYANNEKYYDTQNKLKDTSWHFIESDFYELDKNLPDSVSFDSIVLSNIYEYLNFGFDVSEENSKRYVDFIKNVLLPRVKTNGKILTAYLCRFDEHVDEEVSKRLITDPNGWIPTDNMLKEDMLKFLLEGYTSQNISYHYLLKELAKQLPSEYIHTSLSGYGMSSAKKDLAVVYTKK